MSFFKFGLLLACLVGWASAAVQPTPSDALGPFYFGASTFPPIESGQRVCRQGRGRQIRVFVNIFDAESMSPMTDVSVEVWQANHNSLYNETSGRARV